MSSKSISIGERVVYSSNGVGQVGTVLRTETKKIRGNDTEFVVVKLDKNSLIVYSPKKIDDIKIRKLSDNINLNAALYILKQEPSQERIHFRWDRCVKEAKSMLGFSAPLFGQAECISYLRHIKSKRKLSFEETNLLQEVKESFVSEVSEITNKPKSVVEQELTSYME